MQNPDHPFSSTFRFSSSAASTAALLLAGLDGKARVPCQCPKCRADRKESGDKDPIDDVIGKIFAMASSKADLRDRAHKEVQAKVLAFAMGELKRLQLLQVSIEHGEAPAEKEKGFLQAQIDSLRVLKNLFTEADKTPQSEATAATPA